MKRLIFFFCLFITFHGSAQTVANDQMNILYYDIPNPISIAAFGYTCKSIIVKADFGKVTSIDDGNGCYYYEYHAAGDSMSKVTFSLYAKVGNSTKLIGKRIFRIKKIPNPEAYVGGRRSGDIAINLLRAQEGIIAKIPNLGICASFKVDSFCYAVMRNDKIICTGKNAGNTFNQKIASCFSSMEDKDYIFFYNIFCSGPDNKSLKTESFELRVIK